MRPVGPLPIEPGKPVTLAPGGYHIMLSGLKRTLKQGDNFPITLSFAKAGPVTATATVAKAGATMPAGKMSGMGTMPMQGAGSNLNGNERTDGPDRDGRPRCAPLAVSGCRDRYTREPSGTGKLPVACSMRRSIRTSRL